MFKQFTNKLEVSAGANIEEAIKEAKALCTIFGCVNINFIFNDVAVNITEDSDIEYEVKLCLKSR